MNTSQDVKNETTLASIAEDPESNQHFLLFAVIIDISEPTKTEEGSNYITKLKIIDPSFNYKVELKNQHLRFHKFVHISIYTETPDSAPRIKFVGDIVRLRRFRFKYSDRGELKAYEKKYSNWLIYGGQKSDSLQAQSFKNFAKNVDRDLNKYEEGRISDLRYWSDHFFFANSLRYISWWTDIANSDETLEKGKERHSEKRVDLILKVTKVDTSRKRLGFVDNKGRTFELIIPNAALKLNQIIQLKCVEVTWEIVNKQLVRMISITPQSSCLHIPAFFWDYRNFDKTSSGDKSGTASVKKDAQVFHFLNDYTTEIPQKAKKTSRKDAGEKIVSAVRVKSMPEKVTPIAELLRIISEDPQNNLTKKFLIHGSITGYLSLDPNEIIKRFYIQDKRIARLDEKIQDKKSRIVFHLVPLVRDESVQADQHLQAYILTNEHEYYMFDAWNILPRYDDSQGWNNVKDQKKQDFIKKLNALKKPEYKVRLVVQLMMTKTNKYFFKVVDTVFIAF